MLASPEWLFSDLRFKSWLWSNMKQKTHTPVPDECPHRHIEYSEQFLQCQSWRNCLNLSVPSHIWNIISVHLDEGNTLDYNELQPGSLTLLSMSNLTLLALLQWCVQIRLLGPDKTCKNCGVLRHFGSRKTDIIFNSFIMNVLTCVHYSK